jgi:hypothetical protein
MHYVIVDEKLKCDRIFSACIAETRKVCGFYAADDLCEMQVVTLP